MLELAEIQTRLAEYLGTPLLSLKVLASGWETTVFEFAAASNSSRLPLTTASYATGAALLPGTLR